ncbi:MAG TPA: PH domain-containing protein [Ruminiclostridium sp.]
MEYNKLDKRILVSWRLVRLIGVFIIEAIMATTMVLLSKQSFFEPYIFFAYMFIGITTVYMLMALYLFPAIEYRQWGYIISEDRVEIRHGIFFVKNTVIPIVRVQHITISQGPINRKLGISVVNIHTASGQFGIEGISNEDASSIAEGLKSKLYTRLDSQDK